MKNIVLLALALATLGLAACGSTPARTETNTTSSTSRTEGGGEIRHSTTETRETADDGAQTTERVETTQTSTPPP
jgi:ABC-type glycerol-3-phosphate transport system substrate-binding protein